MGKIAFSLGPLHVYWYGMILALAVLAAIGCGMWQARLRRQPTERILDIALFGIPLAIICARLQYIAANWSLYAGQPGEMVSLWHGGVAAGGAVVGLLLTLGLYSKWEKISFWYWADILTPGLALGQAVGCLANLASQDGFGMPTNQPWGVYIDFLCRPAGYEQFDFFQPLFLYEAFGAFLFFVAAAIMAIFQVRCGTFRPGTLFLAYLLFWASIRFVLDELELNRTLVIGQLTADQVLSILAVAICLCLLFVKLKK